MTIYDLRKVIKATEWINDSGGATIFYKLGSIKSAAHFTFDELVSELTHISSIESAEELFTGYEISQWDALNLVIRHEYAKHMESEIENSDLGKAINKLTK